jgi:type VI protein secretion system component Hcp
MKIFFLYMLTCFIINKTSSQKLEFKKLEFAYFDYDSVSKKTNPYLYANIDSLGKIRVNWFNKNSVGIKTNYFTYQLTSSEIKKMNIVFNNKSKLSSFFITKKLEKNESFCGDFEFFLVDYKDSTKDSVCTIEPFMSKKYEHMKVILVNILFFQEEKNKKIKPFPIPTGFKKSLESMYKKSKFLPGKCKPIIFRLEDNPDLQKGNKN